MRSIKTVVVIALCLGLSESRAAADHLPSSQIALGKPEHVLAGVDVYTDKIKTVIEKFGKPDKYADVPIADGPTGSGERSYEWIRDGVRLRVGTEYYTDRGSKKVVESLPTIVDVWGTRAGHAVGVTGSGLSLGSGLATLERLYGDRFLRGKRSITLQWKDETTLVVDLAPGGVIDHMQLMAAVE